MGILVNIDNGGTFTDVCVSDGRKVVHAKTATTPHDLTQCFLEILKRGSRELYGEDDAARLIREAECLRYSTTSGTNAVVEHKGTPVAESPSLRKISRGLFKCCSLQMFSAPYRKCSMPGCR